MEKEVTHHPKPSLLSRARTWTLDIDRPLNHIMPPSPLPHLPLPISHFLGYRPPSTNGPRPDVGNVLGAFWSLVGAFCGMAVIAAIFNNSPLIQAHHPPVYIASFGASAILEYNAIRSPLGQPRNAVLGHTLSALVGVSITKLFRYSDEFERIRWIAAALSCGVASAVMLLTGTVHPPGGASAVLAAAEPQVTEMGWYFVGLVLLGTTLMVLVGLVVNNIQRQFPVYWWTPIDLRALRMRHRDVERDPGTWADARGGVQERKTREEEENERMVVCVTRRDVSVPDGVVLTEEEKRVLQRLKERLGMSGLETEKREVLGPGSDETVGKVGV